MTKRKARHVGKRKTLHPKSSRATERSSRYESRKSRWAQRRLDRALQQAAVVD